MNHPKSYYSNVSEIKEDTNVVFEIETQFPSKPHYGNNFFFRMKNGQPQYTIGPHCKIYFDLGPLSLCLIISIIGGTYLISSTINIRSGNSYCAISVLSGLILESCFLRVFLKNPGVNFTLTNVERTEDSCVPCKLVKQPGTVHCMDCDICIRGHDHHCPWVGKCIGEGNMMEFQVFLISFMIFFTCNLILVMI